MSDYPIWAFSASDLRDMERYAEPMPGENFHALTDPDEEDAARGEELEFNHTRYAGWDEAS